MQSVSSGRRPRLGRVSSMSTAASLRDVRSNTILELWSYDSLGADAAPKARRPSMCSSLCSDDEILIGFEGLGADDATRRRSASTCSSLCSDDEIVVSCDESDVACSSWDADWNTVSAKLEPIQYQMELSNGSACRRRCTTRQGPRARTDGVYNLNWAKVVPAEAGRHIEASIQEDPADADGMPIVYTVSECVHEPAYAEPSPEWDADWSSVIGKLEPERFKIGLSEGCSSLGRHAGGRRQAKG